MKRKLKIGIVFLGILLLPLTTVKADEVESNSIIDIIARGEISPEIEKQAKNLIEEEKIESRAESLQDYIENSTPIVDIPNQRIVVLPQAEALLAWRAGTKVVRDSGFKNTAMYMKHAEAPKNGNPTTHTSNNNAWAKDVLFNDGIMGNTWSQYRTWVMGNKKTLTVKGSYAFNAGDKKLALQKVNYSYTFTRQANGGVKTTGTALGRPLYVSSLDRLEVPEGRVCVSFIQQVHLLLVA